MDDPWGNAWAERTQPADTAASPKLQRTPSTPAWPAPGKFGAIHDDSEADLSMPSWSADGGISWNETHGSQGSLWGTSETVNEAWTPATNFDQISIGKPSSDVPSTDAPPSPEPDEGEVRPASPPREPDDLPKYDIRPATPIISLPTDDEQLFASELSRSASPDGFGSFEDGVAAQGVSESTSQPWLSADNSTLGAEPSSAWGTAWETAQAESPVEDEPEDEWTAAKRQKEMLDARVPPEVLAAIIRQCDEIAAYLSPDPGPPLLDLLSARDSPRTLEDVEGLTTLVSRLAPSDPPVQPPLQFVKTHTMKGMSGSLKLSRNAPLTRHSPLTLFATSKGSSTWEASMKSNRLSIGDDVPTGWRIVEKKDDDSTKEIQEKPKAGGIMGFFSKRASIVPKEAAASAGAKAPSGSVSPRTGSPRASTSSPRASMDTVRSTPSASSVPAPPALQAASPTVPTPPQSPRGPDFFPEPPVDPTAPAVTPSAVSRFFGRFSRTKSSSPGSSRLSLALSGDDLDHLGDIIPSALDDAADNQPMRFDGLEAMIKSEPVMAGKLPPTLPPPPPSSRPVRANTESSLGHVPILPTKPPSGSRTSSMGSAFLPPPPTSAPGSLSSAPRSNNPPSLPSSFLISPPPKPSSSGRATPASAALPARTVIANPPPPPVSAPTQAAGFHDDFDDFDDFQVSAGLQPSQTYDTSFGALNSEADLFGDLAQSQSAPALTTSFALPTSSLAQRLSNASDASADGLNKSMAGFDDFDDFVTSPMQSPNPVQPPNPVQSPVTKSPPTTVQPRGPAMSLTSSSAMVGLGNAFLPPPGQLASEHQATASLVEKAAAQPGRWPSLPNSVLSPPLPAPLPPPSLASISAPSFDLDIFGDAFTSGAPVGMAPIPQAAPPAQSVPQSKKPDHLPTLNLVNMAATKSSVWPAPRTPLPDALPPPGSFIPEPAMINGNDASLLSPAAASFPPVAPPPTAGHSRTGSKVDHHAAESLVAKAASRQGTWPAPHSPLPIALEPPPGAPSEVQKEPAAFPWGSSSARSPPPHLPPPMLSMPASASAVKPILGPSIALRAFSPPPMSNSASPAPAPPVAILRALSPPPSSRIASPAPLAGGLRALSPPPSSKPSPSPASFAAPMAASEPASLMDFGAPAQPPAGQPTKLSTTSGKGGLSAQDLSFFEGL